MKFEMNDRGHWFRLGSRLTNYPRATAMGLFPFSSVMFVQKSFKFSITVISLSYDICSAFQD